MLEFRILVLEFQALAILKFRTLVTVMFQILIISQSYKSQFHNLYKCKKFNYSNVLLYESYLLEIY